MGKSSSIAMLAMKWVKDRTGGELYIRTVFLIYETGALGSENLSFNLLNLRKNRSIIDLICEGQWRSAEILYSLICKDNYCCIFNVFFSFLLHRFPI